MENYVIARGGNYVIDKPSNLGNYVIADTSGRSCTCSGFGPALSVRMRHKQVRTGSDGLAPQGVGEESAVSGEQHPGLKSLRQELVGQTASDWA